MVKGYDPTTSDPSKIVLQYLIRWTNKQNPLSMHEAQRFVKYWLKNSAYTSQIYKKFKQQKTKIEPNIKLKKKCFSNWLNIFPKQFDSIFPAYQNFENQKNQIVICLNHITSKCQLKENLDRELTIMYQQAKQKKLIKKQQQIEEKDIKLMESILKGCHAGYKNYLIDKQIQDRLSLKCAKYLFFRRTQRKLPHDSLFRYTTKISQQINV